MNNPLNIFYFNFYKIGLLTSLIGFSYSDALRYVDDTKDQALNNFFAILSQDLATGTGDLTKTLNHLALLEAERKEIIIATSYLKIFSEMDNSIFTRFHEAAVLYLILRCGLSGGEITGAMKDFILATDMAFLGNDHTVWKYLISVVGEIDREVDKAKSMDIIEVETLFAPVEDYIYELDDDLSQVASLQASYSGMPSPVPELSRKLGLFASVLKKYD